MIGCHEWPWRLNSTRSIVLCAPISRPSTVFHLHDRTLSKRGMWKTIRFPYPQMCASVIVFIYKVMGIAQ